MEVIMRQGNVRRRTAETDISLEINIDGSGQSSLDTSIPFLDHMLNLFARQDRKSVV
jgi:imidazoleglycerol-phosphate dehydratase